jgi:hypothetical protein
MQVAGCALFFSDPAGFSSPFDSGIGWQLLPEPI